MTRINFSTFGEASEYSKKLAMTHKISSAIHKESNTWWVDDPRIDCSAPTFLLKSPFDIENLYIDGDGIITDTNTWLAWHLAPDKMGKMDWHSASVKVAVLQNGQYGLGDGSKSGDWRLPTDEEVKSLPSEILSKIPNNRYWTSTSKDDPENLAIIVEIFNNSSSTKVYGKHWSNDIGLLAVRNNHEIRAHIGPFNCNGYNKYGFDKNGFDRDGYDVYGYDLNGIGRGGFDRKGYDQEGYDKNGYNKDGKNRNGYLILSKWFDFIELFPMAKCFENEFSIVEIYGQLNDKDTKIAEEWANSEEFSGYKMARMLSARAAEKATKTFYQSLGFKVDDISILQLNMNESKQESSDSKDWKLFDLLLNDEISIDVKNARTTLNSKVTYVEHCVSRFKNNRNNQNVIIAGVLSPYLKLNDIQNPQYIHYEATIKYLGETTISNFIKLQERFSKRFLKLSFNAMNFIPRWLFEFPERFYAIRNEQISILQQIKIELTPTIAYCEKTGVNPIPAYLASGINLPDAWKTDLRDWQIDFFSQIRPCDNSAVTMPVLFLALLVHFLEAVTQDEKWKKYEPRLYRQLIYAGVSTAEDLRMPLGIFDPLGTIESFIETLSILWNNKELTNLKEFELFKFNGVGLLEGKRLNKQKYETILAYCGGFIEGKGKCGNNPLILGKHESCPGCGKLICEKCGYCSANCQQCERRMQNLTSASVQTGAEGYHDLNHDEENPFGY